MSRRVSPSHAGARAGTAPGRSPDAAPQLARPEPIAGAERLALALLLALAFLLALAYSRATPPGANPDEAAHVEYVRVLAEEHRFPVLDLTRRRASHHDLRYEAHQPPLYYLLAVPFYVAGRALGGPEGAVHGVRLLSMLVTAAGTLLLWALAREIAPGRPALRLLAAGFAAFLPMRLAVGAAATNDPLAEATSTLALLAMVRILHPRGGDPGPVREGALVGLAIGLALLAKMSAAVLLPPALVALYLSARRAGPAALPRRFLAAGGAAAAAALLVAGGWLLRNQLLYGDPLAKGAFDWYFADTVRWEDFRQTGFTFGRYLAEKVYPTTFASFWGAFGHLDPRHPELFMGAYGPGAPGPHWGYPPKSWLYPILGWAVLASAAGGALALLRRGRRKPGPAAPEAASQLGALLLGLHALFVVAVFLQFNSLYFQAQGRYLFPAIGALSLALAAGWLECARRLPLPAPAFPIRGGSGEQPAERWLALTLVAAMAALALYALVGVLLPGFRAA